MNEPTTCGHHRGTHPVDILEHEHAVILRVLDAADQERRLLERGAPLREAFWRSYLDFLEHYADNCHHSKEEDGLFAALEAGGLPSDVGPTSAMRMEHVELRSCRARLAEALTSDDVETICHLVKLGTDGLRLHIERENNVLFPLARQLLNDSEMKRVTALYEAIESNMGDGTHCRWEQVAESLCADHTVSS